MSGAAARLFDLPERGVVEVTGEDRVRWLDGMLTNDVAAAAAAPGGGCDALLLSRQGRILARFHLLAMAERVWLETDRAAIAPALEALEKLLIADDVTLADVSASQARLALEGPGATEVVAAACSGAALPAAHGFVEAELAGAPVHLAAFGFTGGPALQVFAPADGARAVRDALVAAGAEPGDAALLDRLRIEAGTPRFGAELDASVLPDEARLGDAVSTTKGCYVGQEVVARLRSRQRVNHLLVGLRLAEPAAPGAEIRLEDRRLGEVTSAAVSPDHGPIALGYVPSASSAPGTRVEVGGREARVAELPFAGDAGAA